MWLIIPTYYEDGQPRLHFHSHHLPRYDMNSRTSARNGISPSTLAIVPVPTRFLPRPRRKDIHGRDGTAIFSTEDLTKHKMRFGDDLLHW